MLSTLTQTDTHQQKYRSDAEWKSGETVSSPVWRDTPCRWAEAVEESAAHLPPSFGRTSAIDVRQAVFWSKNLFDHPHHWKRQTAALLQPVLSSERPCYWETRRSACVASSETARGRILAYSPPEAGMQGATREHQWLLWWMNCTFDEKMNEHNSFVEWVRGQSCSYLTWLRPPST